MTQIAAYLSENTLQALGVEHPEWLEAAQVFRFAEGGGKGAGISKSNGEAMETVMLAFNGKDVMRLSVQKSGGVRISKNVQNMMKYGPSDAQKCVGDKGDPLGSTRSNSYGDMDGVIAWVGNVGHFQTRSKDLKGKTIDEIKEYENLLKLLVFSR